ncbi:hypothetical protein N752_22160 [Desulforamulus aquiferis]|nr:hypothetical protein N752_22160 [Desulforamulus aquiferis]
MRIVHNVLALNSVNKLKNINKNLSKSVERLSTGLRINKAADDAAGLSISEKMKAQIRGLQQAQRNIQDGISLIQTAEGGLANILEPPLQRMRELAIQAANDTLSFEDRQAIQKEISQMISAIDGIADNTEFNGIKLLNGNVSDEPARCRFSGYISHASATENTPTGEYMVDFTAKATNAIITGDYIDVATGILNDQK